MSVFDPAIVELLGCPSFWGPHSFLAYLRDRDLSSNRKTAELISVNSLETLDPSLILANTMVLRLGQSETKGTQFGLVRTDNDLKSFFLVDQEIFGGIVGRTFVPTASPYALSPFHLLSALSETALVNLAFASGVIRRALSLEDDETTTIATGAINSTFNVRPYSKLAVEATHKNGQVQIDAMFMALQEGRHKLFIVEAKSGGSKSLAKHKLVYPILALANRIRHDIEIVPVYLRINRTASGYQFLIAEGLFPDPRISVAGIDELFVVNAHDFTIPFSVFQA
ncbi:MAG TPA: hypothetical protein PLL77_15825 [Pyrinomonadaceae bacterium]|nr:hypothetical protein [Pyrinomonadaceae bacterium]